MEAKDDRTFWGRVVDASVGAQLYGSALRGGFNLYYWRENNAEVDYVVKKGEELVALEVKSGLKKTTVRGFKAFEKRYGKARTLVVGSEEMPLEKFLMGDVLDLFA